MGNQEEVKRQVLEHFVPGSKHDRVATTEVTDFFTEYYPNISPRLRGMLFREALGPVKRQRPGSRKNTHQYYYYNDKTVSCKGCQKKKDRVKRRLQLRLKEVESTLEQEQQDCCCLVQEALKVQTYKQNPGTPSYIPVLKAQHLSNMARKTLGCGTFGSVKIYSYNDQLVAVKSFVNPKKKKNN